MKATINFLLLATVTLFFSCGSDSPGDKMLDAAEQGDIATIEMYLGQGVDINFQNSGIFESEVTACMRAAENGQLEVLKFLVDKGANFEMGNSGGETPITLAASKNHQEVVLYLIDKGIDINYQESNYGFTALLHAAGFGDVDYIKTLVKKGADLDVRNKVGNTPMTCAAAAQKAQAVKYFIKKGADPDEAGHYGWHALACAVTSWENSKYDLPDDMKETIDVLLAAGADIDKQDADGNTVLIHAGMSKSTAVVNYLLKKGADKSITNNAGGDYLDAMNSTN